MTTENIATLEEIQEATINMQTVNEEVKSTANTLVDQYGTTRKTMTGRETEFNTQIADHEAEFDAQLASQVDTFQNRFALSDTPIPWSAGLLIEDELQLYSTGTKGESGYSVWLPDPSQLPFETSATFAEDESLGRWKVANPLTDDWGDITYGTQVKHRRGTNAEILAGTPAIGELWFNTTDNTIHMGDGATQGGYKIPNRADNDTRYTLEVANVLALTTGAISAVGSTVSTRGYYTPGDKGGAEYINRGQGWPVTADGFIDHCDVSGNFLEMVSNVTLKRAGAIGDNSTPASDSVRSAFGRSGTVTDEGGEYYLDKTINVQYVVDFKGANGADAATYATKFRCADGIVGFFLHRADTTADDTGVPAIVESGSAGPGADGTVMSSFSLTGTGSQTSDNDGTHGIWRKCRSTIKNATIVGFKGDGIYTRASGASSDPYERGNANVSKIESVRCVANAGDGASYLGSDVNAGSTYSFNGTRNGGWGMMDSSFLGNYHFGGHYDGNTLGPYTTTNANNQSTWIGTYVEPGQPAADLSVGRALSIGGLHSPNPIGAYMYGDSGILKTPSGFGYDATSSLGNRLTAQLGGNTDAGQILSFNSTGAGESTVWRLSYRNDTLPDIYMTYANSTNQSPFRITGDSTTEQGGTASTLPFLMCHDELGLGSGNNLRRVTFSDREPTSGEYGRGDIIFSRATSAGGKSGWVCTVAGTAGSTAVFKQFGSIDV